MTLAALPELNSEQAAVVQSVDGFVLLVAGPGTGKTRALTSRISHLIQEKKVPLNKIVALTFTRAAALEMKTRLNAPDDLWILTFHALALRILKEYSDALYQAALKQVEAEEFDEILDSTNQFLKSRPDVQALLRSRFSYVLVDEFQDTSLPQYELLQFLIGENVLVTGDPDQSIYGSLNDGFHAFQAFQNDRPQARVFHLSQNYRSQTSILEAAKQVIAKNESSLPRKLQSLLEEGLPVDFLDHASDKEEATMVVRWIERLIGGSSHFMLDSQWADDDHEKGKYSLGDIVVLYRYHAQARLIEKALQTAGLPYKTLGKETKTDYEDADADVPSEAIRLMTLHRAKGLEFPVVFVLGCEPEIKIHDNTNPEEERRLFYVGMTRARKRLFLSTAHQRFLFGKTWATHHSFVHDIQQELLRVIKRAPGTTPQKKAVQIDLFK